VKLDKKAAGHERLWTRYRGRVWTSVTPIENLQFNVRVITEPRYYFKPETMEDQFVRQEALFDQFNIQWAKVGGLPLKLTVGRQDIKFGDGWLIAEGTPLDGSRTFFFDAIRATWDASDIKTTFDVITIRNRANSSYFIRPFDDKNLDLIEHDETGVILYGSNKSIKNTTIDGYFIYKHDDRVAANGNNSDIYTFGARATGKMDEHWKYGAELAPQFGQKNGTKIAALGFNSELGYYLNDKLDNNFRVMYEYLSGAGKRDGAFDVLWGRYAKWSNIYNDCLTDLENLKSQATNYHRVGFGWGFKPAEKLTFEANYNLFFRDRNTFSGTQGFSDKGPFRGQLLTALLKHTITEHLSTALTAELFLPGNYYDHTRNDAAVYIQYEIMLSW